MKPLFSEKINESLKKYQPTHVEKDWNVRDVEVNTTYISSLLLKNTRMVTSIKTVANVKSMRNINETSNGR